MTARLLIVDDDPGTLLAVSAALRERFPDLRLDTASSAEAALLLSAATDYDVIISDIRMPGMDGVAFLKEIKRLRPETPVLLVTGHSNLDIEDHALRSGVYAFIEKPIELEQFLPTVARAMQRAQLARRVREEELKDSAHAVAQPLGWESTRVLERVQEVNEKIRRKIKSLIDRSEE